MTFGQRIAPDLVALKKNISDKNMYSGNKIPASVMAMFKIEVKEDSAGILVPYWIGVLQRGRGPRRGSNFVTQKVVNGDVNIDLGVQDKLELGNMDSYRDWGHSKDYVRAMHLIINHDTPDDFVVSTMETHSVRDMCNYVFNTLGMDYKDYVIQNPRYMRSEELPYLRGDSTKIRLLGWQPEYTFETLMKEMIAYAYSR